MNSRRAILCDIDGTLADCRHRLHFVLPGAKRDWDAFFAAMDDDSLIEPVRELIYSVDLDETAVILCSGRPENYREVTENWLRYHSVLYTGLYMRPVGDTRADHIVKSEMLDQIIADGWAPFIVIEDRESVVSMWRERGLVCLQAAPGQMAIPASATLTLMVGPSGGGKSTWLADEWADAEVRPADLKIHPRQIISSDAMREELCGDFRDQSRNQDVFTAVHDLAKARLRNGLSVVIDATHLRRKDRMTAAKLVPETTAVRYVVIDRPEAEKRRDAGWRGDLPVDLIARHAQILSSNLRDILAGDGLPNVRVFDLRRGA